MRMFLAFLFLSVLAVPADAEDSAPGTSLIERGAQMFLEGILREMEPALEDLSELGPAVRQFVEEMGPALSDVLAQVQDWSQYSPPEILPNGDIIIRRKPKPEPVPDDPAPQIDL